MTKNQVLSIPGFHPETAKAIAEYLRSQSCCQVSIVEATHLIRNEGKMQGIHEAASKVDGLLTPEKPEQPSAEKQLYPDPSQRTNR